MSGAHEWVAAHGPGPLRTRPPPGGTPVRDADAHLAMDA